MDHKLATIHTSINQLGYAIISPFPPSEHILPVEDLVLEVTSHSSEYPVMQAMPYVLATQNWDKSKLETGDRQKIGYLASVAATYRPKEQLEELVFDFFSPDFESATLLAEVRPELAKILGYSDAIAHTWKILGGLDSQKLIASYSQKID